MEQAIAGTALEAVVLISTDDLTCVTSLQFYRILSAWKFGREQKVVGVGRGGRKLRAARMKL